ncbi:MAG TPA: hypothetical protein VK864_03440, partial [Longimicrobiales bacterium]|nr:hypothetical protein [Longimicrobiales bacterium]
MRRLVIACALLGPGSAASLAAQGTCEVISGPRTVINEVGPATYISGRTRIRCDDGLAFIADSMFSAYGRRLLIGNVEFSDPEKTVTSQRLDHDSRSGIVIATGATVVTDRKTGSVLNAPQGLQYTRESGTTPAQLVVSSGRPHLTLYRDRTSGTRDTTEVDSNLMRLVGENVFYGTGNVV